MKPFLKWAGGKGQLIYEIQRYYPFEHKNIVKYAEPFVGGGAVLFDILSKYDLQDIYISDMNDQRVVRRSSFCGIYLLGRIFIKCICSQTIYGLCG